MDELIRKALETYFSDFKQYHLIILIGFTLVIALIQVIQSMWVNWKMEKLKSELKKTEIKFSKYNQLQIDALGKIYKLSLDFLEQNFIIERDIILANPEKKNKITTEWLKAYKSLNYSFSAETYILPKKVKERYKSILSQLVFMKLYIKTEKEMSTMFHIWENGEIEFMGNDQERINLDKQLKMYSEKGNASETSKNIIKLRTEIEKYFENIE